MPQIDQLLHDIESNDIVLPEFQREFVWKKSQAKELMISLYSEYPIGSLLLWKTENPPEIKNNAVNREDSGTFRVLLDGQQRLTVLYLLIKDSIPPYYSKGEIRSDPRGLCLNLETGELRYESRTLASSLDWVKVVDAFNEKPNIFSIAEQKTADPASINAKAKKYQNRLNQIKGILKLDMPVQELPKSANIHQAIELFDKVNSQGTELGDSELALAHMSAQWPHIRREMKKKQTDMAEKGFSFNLDFYVKCLIGVITNGMTYERVYDVPEDKLVDNWQTTEKALDYAINFLKHEGNMPDSSYLSSRAVPVPLIVYISKNDIALNHRQKANFLHWIYAALMWSRYGGSTDTRLEKDLSLLRDGDNPTRDLVEEIRDQRGRIQVQSSDLAKRGKRSKRFFNMVKIVIRANEPVDWKTGAPLKGSYELESHHIFPKSRLYETVYASKSSDDILKVNEIANRAFLTPHGNRKILNDVPENYLPVVQSEHPDALDSQLIPPNEELWKMDNYEEFLKQRRKLLASYINDFLSSIRVTPNGNGERDVKDIIRQGEDHRTEFKETFLWDVYRDRANKELKDEVAKELAALANADGGHLIIGVQDHPVRVKGIERDLKLMKKGLDSFEVQLNQILTDKLGNVFPSIYTTVDFEEVEKKMICKITVEPSPDPVYYEGGDFYVRSGTSSKHLSAREANEYIEEQWR